MNICDLVDEHKKAVDRREKEKFREEIEELLSREPFTFKDVALIIASMVATSAIVLFLEKVIKAEMD